MVPDETLAQAYMGGDPDSFELLFERYHERATAYAWRIVRRREVAEEICLEAFARVTEGQWRPTGSFRSYLFTIVHRLCLDTLRKRKRRASAHLKLVEGGSTTPEADAEADQDRVRLEQALAAIPEKHRSVLLLYYGQELSSREVAEVLGIEDQQVRSRLSYARKLLRQRLEET